MSNVGRKSHLNLILWQKAVDLAVETYRLSGTFPRSEVYGLVSQIRRAAVSIPSNIAEGAARRTTRDFLAFLHVARGSLAEVETQLLIAQRVGAVPPNACSALQVLVDEVGRILQAFINSLRERGGAASSD
jgi:four helix bundle protein